MAVILLRAYGGFASGAQVTFPDSTETALIAQGLATASLTTVEPSVFGGPDQYVLQGGNYAAIPAAGQSTPANLQGPSILPNIALGSAALTGYETNGVTQTALTWNFAEIFVPYWNRWTGAGWLNGTTVGTTGVIAALWGTSGALISYTTTAYTTTAGASIFQNAAFVNTGLVATPVLLAPGRYFLGLQQNSTGADTFRHILAANGSNVMCGTVAGALGVVPATITVPTTFTTAVAPIMQLYT